MSEVSSSRFLDAWIGNLGYDRMYDLIHSLPEIWSEGYTDDMASSRESLLLWHLSHTALGYLTSSAAVVYKSIC